MAIRLHVVYAGRGDAMVLEDGDRYYIVDGGPQGWTPKTYSGAPYPRYLMATLLAVRDEVRPNDRWVAPDAIVVTHAHEDHYGGIASIFDRFLSKTYTTDGSTQLPFVFNGPLVTQVLPMDGAEPWQNELKAFGFNKPSGGLPGPVDQALRFSRFSWWARQPPTVARTWDPDTSELNLASVIGYHAGGRILLTGDSTGALIRGFVADAGNRVQLPLTLLKLAHHGSLRNAQRLAGHIEVPAAAWQQYALAMILDRDAVTRLAPPVVFQPVWDTMRLRARAVLLRRMLQQNIPEQAFLDGCKAAIGTTLDNIDNIDGNGDVPWVYCRDEPNTITSLFNAVKKRLVDENPWEHFVLNPGTAIDPSYASDLAADVMGERFLAYQAMGRLTRFFRDVPATNYVVSADGTHGHPAAETLAAIARAAAADNRYVRVFVTEAKSVASDRLTELEPNWAGRMSIRYLARGARMILDVSAGADQWPGVTGLDPQATTQALTALDQAGAGALAWKFRFNEVLSAMPRRRLVDTTYRFVAQVNGNAAYLNMALDGTLRIGNNQQSLVVEEGWSLVNATSLDQIRLNTTPDNNGNVGRCLTTLSRAVFGGYRIRLAPDNPELYVSTDPNNPSVGPNANNIAVFQLQEVTSADALEPIPEDAPTGGPLSTFLTRVGIDPSQPLLGLDLLRAAAGPADAATLVQRLHAPIAQRILTWQVDVASSELTFTDDRDGPLVTAATIAITLGDDRSFTFDGEARVVVSATLALTGTDRLRLAVQITDDKDEDISFSSRTDGRRRDRTLDAYLHDAGLPPEQLDQLRLSSLLTGIIGHSEPAEQLLRLAPSFLVAANLASWPVDRARSSIATQASLSGYPDVTRADVALTAPANQTFTIAGLMLDLADARVVVEDARLRTLRVTLHASLTWGGFALAASAELSGTGDHALELALPPGTGLADLIAALPSGASGADTLPVPQMPVNTSTLGSLDLTDLAVRIRQPAPATDTYVLDELRATVRMSNWPPPALLPGSVSAASTVVALRVLAPLDDTHRAVAYDAGFALTVAGKSLRARFAASPLPQNGSAWAYTFSVASPVEDAVTVAELLSVVGLGDAAGAIGSTLPVLGDVVDALAVANLEVVLDVAGGAATVDTFDLALILAQPLTVISGVLELPWGAVRLRHELGTWSGSIEAAMTLGGSFRVRGAYELGTATSPGRLSLGNDSPDLTANALLGLIGIQLPTLPVVSDLLDATLLDLALEVPVGGGMPTAFSTTFQAGAQTLGRLDLDALVVELSHRSDGATSFKIEATWGTATVAELAYDTTSGRLAGRLRTDADRTLASLLDGLVPGISAAVPSAVRALQVRDASLVLDTGAGFGVRSLHVDLNGAPPPLGGAALTELQLRYEVGTGTADDPQTYELEGRLSGTNADGELTLSLKRSAPDVSTLAASIVSRKGSATGVTVGGLLTLFGITAQPSAIEAPAGVPTPSFDVRIARAGAEVAITDAGWSLASLDVRADMVGEYAPFSGMTISGLGFELRYATEPATAVTGGIFLVVQLAGLAVELAYTTADGFQGLVTGATNLQALLAAPPFTQAPPLPADEGLPATIGLDGLHVHARPGSFFEAWGQGTDVWQAQVAGCTIDVTSLGGRIRAEFADGTTTYQGEVRGALTFNGFVSTSARMVFTGEERVVVAEAADVSGVSLSAMAGALAPTTTWDGVVPAGTTTPAVDGADRAFLYLDLAQGVFVFYGAVAGMGTLALISRPATDGGDRGYLLALDLGAEGFTLASVWPALSAVDPYVALTAANATILTNPGTVQDLRDVLAAVRAYGAPALPFDDLADLRRPATDPLPAGMTLFGAADLARGSLTEALGKMAAQPPQLVLRAVIAHDAPAGSTFEVLITNLPLVGRALVIASGTATYVHASQGTDSLALHADVDVRLTETSAAHRFTGDFTVTDAAATMALAVAGAPIADPFGGMLGITVTAPQLSATYTFATESTPASSAIAISGEAALRRSDGSTVAGLAASILFVDAVPRVARVALTAPLNVLDLFATVFSAGQASWPAAYPTITVATGATLYYARVEAGDTTVTVDGVEYGAGYRITGTVDFFGAAFAVDLEIRPDAGGIALSAAYVSEIDLTVAKLSNAAVTITTGESPTVYGAQADLALFGTALGRLALAYAAAPDNRWKGSLTYSGTLFGVSDPSVAFSYTDTDGLRLDALPGFADELLDWADALRKASDGQTCRQLLGLVFDKALTTRCRVALSQGGAPTSDGIPFVVGGTFDIVLQSNGSVLASLPLPSLNGVIPTSPSPFSTDKLPEWLGTLLVANARSMGACLLERPNLSSLTAVIAIMDSSGWGMDLLARLICRGVDSPNVIDRFRRGIHVEERKLDDDSDDPDAPLKVLIEAVVVAVAVTALADLVGKGALVETAFVAAIAFIDGLLAWLYDALGPLGSLVPGLEAAKERVEQKRREAQAQRARYETFWAGVLAVGAPPQVTFPAADTMTVTWTRPAKAGFDYGNYDGVGYAVTVKAPSIGLELTQSGLSAPTATFQDARLAQTNDLVVEVVGTHGDYVGIVARTSAFHVTPMAAPATVTAALGASSAAIDVTTAAVAEARSYTIELFDPFAPEAVLGSRLVLAGVGAPTCHFGPGDLPAGAATTTLQVRAQAAGDPARHTASAFTEASSVPITALAAGTTVTLGAGDTGLTATWTAVRGVDDWAVRLVDATGQPLDRQPAAVVTGTTATIADLGDEHPTEVAAEVRPRVTGELGLWSAPSAVCWLWRPDPPTAVFAQPENEVLVSWAPVEDADGYLVWVSGEGGQALDPVPTMTLADDSATVAGPAIGVGLGSYEVRLQAQRGNVLSLLSEPAVVNPAEMPSPAPVTLGAGDAGLDAGWAPVAGATAMQVALTGGPPVAGQTVTSGNGVTFPYEQLAVQATYTVSVRAQGASVLGPPATATCAVPPLVIVATTMAERGGVGATDNARICAAMRPAIGPVELTLVLVACNYGNDAFDAVRAQLPGVTDGQMAQIEGALGNPDALAPLIRAESVDAVETALLLISQVPFPGSGGQAMPAAILKRCGVTQADAAQALSIWGDPFGYDVGALVSAVYMQPWNLGRVLVAFQVDNSLPQLAFPDTKAAYPAMGLSLVMATLFAPGAFPYEQLAARWIGDVWGTFSAADYAFALMAGIEDDSGRTLAQAAQQEGVLAADAVSWLESAFSLSADAAQAMVVSVYGAGGA